MELEQRFAFETGDALDDVTVAYETWGELNPSADNAVLVMHALTGDSHAHGFAGAGHPTDGWWDRLIGPGAPIDTDRYFVDRTRYELASKRPTNLSPWCWR